MRSNLEVEALWEELRDGARLRAPPAESDGSESDGRDDEVVGPEPAELE